jgi:uncharacterized protein YcfL
MKKHLLSLVIFSLLLTGCSSPEPELSYDPVELIEYEECLRFYANTGNTSFYCDDIKPVPR